MSLRVVLSGNSVSVPYSQSGTVSSVIESSLKKAGIIPEPSDRYVLRYNKKDLDNSYSLRRAGVSQGASLTLHKLRTKKQETTKIALQLPSQGKRLFATLPTRNTLWDILVHFEKDIGKNIVSSPDANYSYPMINFMNRSFSTLSELQSNTIASLGAQNGLLRLSFGTETGKTVRELGLYIEPPPDDPSNHLETVETTTPVTNQEGKQEEQCIVDSVSDAHIASEESKNAVQKTSAKQTIHGEDKKESEESKLDTPERKLLYFPPKRRALASSSPIYESDEVFQLRAADLNTLKGSKDVSKMAPLEKKAYLAKQAQKYKIVKIRIVFPDRQQIEAQFNIKEKLRAVVNLIKGIITEPNKNMRLFITPPKQVLDLNHSFFDAKLYPAARLHVEWEGSQPDPLFKEGLDMEIVENTTTNKETKVTPEKASKPQNIEEPVAQPTKTKQGTNVPKWFLAGRK